MVHESGAENLLASGEKAMLWNKRFGYIRDKGLWILHCNGMVEGMFNFFLDFNFCEHCVYGKKNEVIFPSIAKREKGIVEVVDNDVFRYMSVP